jgi:hypothetical protein
MRTQLWSVCTHYVKVCFKYTLLFHNLLLLWKTKISELHILYSVGVKGEGGDWIDLPQVMDRWRALVNAVMDLRFPKMRTC